MRRRYKHLTEKDFNVNKTLLENGLSKAKVANISERSYFTVAQISKSNSFSDYENLIKSIHENYMTKKNGHAIEPKKDLLVILVKINQNLERMANAWESHPNKESFVRKILRS